jgi:uncharacterized protein
VVGIAEGGKARDNATGLEKAACHQRYPALSGRVVDGADLLSPAEEAALIDWLADLEARTKHQLAVATVTSLQSKPIDSYSLCLANHWAIGRKGVNDGVLLLVAPNERRARIEVGYGLEALLTDAEAKTIMDHDILPAFKQGNYPAGIAAGVSSIIAEIGSPAP